MIKLHLNLTFSKCMALLLTILCFIAAVILQNATILTVCIPSICALTIGKVYTDARFQDTNNSIPLQGEENEHSN